MIATPVLRCSGLVLEPFQERHLTARYVNWLNDPAVVKFSEQRHKVHDMESCRAYAASYAGTSNHLWAIVADRFGHIGNINAAVDAPNQVADLAILIGQRECWGQGLGTRAWTVALEWLLQGGGMRKVTAGTMATNRSMLFVMKKSGMTPDGCRRAQCLLDGSPVDVVLMASFRDGTEVLSKQGGVI